MVSGFRLTRRLLLTLGPLALLAAPPAPREHFGFDPGDDYRLAGYEQIVSYFQKLASSSDRIRLVEFGRSSEGRPMYAAFISDAANLRQLDRWRDINRRLALGQASPEEARRLAAEGRAIVWIDSGLHATEVAPVQHAPHLAWRMITGESEEIRRIRSEVVLIQVPVINPDGLEMVASWYARNVGTPYEIAPLPWLYQKYAGHDNNRDYFMYNLAETRHVGRMLFQEWFPHIVYNQHQVAPFPARIFIPPYAEPLNPNIPAAVMEGIHRIGSVMKERFLREDKPGAVSYLSFDGWWNGGLRSAPAFHNMHGILTETALYYYATPKEYRPSEVPERFSNGLPAREPTIFYPKPWLGGRWALRDAVEYMLTADFAILSEAASNRSHYLLKAWEMARANIEAGRRGNPFAWIVPPDQHDPWSAAQMLERLLVAGIDVHRATAPFAAGGREYPAGTHILYAAQPFRGYLVDLMEPQKYPEMRTGAAGAVRRPYDLAGWTLPFQMGVRTVRVDAPFEAQTGRLDRIDIPAPELDLRRNSAFLAIASALREGRRVYLSREGQLSLEKPAAGWELKLPRVGLYVPFTANMDAGWTAWLFDQFQTPWQELRNSDVRGGALRDRFDVIVLAQQSMQSILHGTPGVVPLRGGETARQRPEFTGGIGLEGARHLEEFVRRGGTLIAFDQATELPLALFPIDVRGGLRATSGGQQEGGPQEQQPEQPGGWFCPGSVLRMTADPSHPLAFGMPAEHYATSTGGQFFEIRESPAENKPRAFVWYAKSNLLASGWVSGERVVAGKPAAVEAPLGAGRVVLFGFRPQFRGQTFGTFRLVLNAVWQSAASPLP
ncbi:MAG: M14 family zinc carboxypeptidase [Bryobacteraceae bacterium]|nr:M14 family zinc carboxypeptidase [Bryobacteraceae bacterium]